MPNPSTIEMESEAADVSPCCGAEIDVQGGLTAVWAQCSKCGKDVDLWTSKGSTED